MTKGREKNEMTLFVHIYSIPGTPSPTILSGKCMSIGSSILGKIIFLGHSFLNCKNRNTGPQSLFLKSEI